MQGGPTPITFSAMMVIINFLNDNNHNT